MTTLDRAAAYKAERDALVAYLRKLPEDAWLAPSRCPGWSVKDVVSHMSAAVHGTFTPWVIGLMTSSDIEAANERDVARRREWEPSKVLREYERWSRRLVPVQGLLQKPGMRGVPIKVGEVGTFPAKQLTSAFVFDTSLHFRYDIVSAVEGAAPAPARPADDANRLGVALEWMIAGLPKMSGDGLSWLDRPVELNLVGPGGGTWTIRPGTSGRVTVVAQPSAEASASVEGDAADFLLWSTRRTPWREQDLSLKGDEELAERFLDGMRIF